MQIEDFFADYVRRLSEALQKIDKSELEKLYSIIQQGAILGQTFYVCGNGGSAAIAEHFTCDHSKGVYNNTKGNSFFINPKFLSLTNNVSLTTAIANDLGYDKVFSEQLNMFAKKGDVLIVISSSGNSPNIVEAIYAARKIGMKVVSLTGFSGGSAKDNCDVSIHVPALNYGISEDAHQIVMHILAQYISIKHTVDKNTLRL